MYLLILLRNPQNRRRHDDKDEEASEREAEQFKRPVGRKRMKHQLEKGQLSCKRLKVTEATLEAQKERNKLLLFTSNVDTSDFVAMEYMTIKRK